MVLAVFRGLSSNWSYRNSTVIVNLLPRLLFAQESSVCVYLSVAVLWFG